MRRFVRNPVGDAPVTFLCWFGVNLLGVGLHSYGFQNGTAMWLALFVAVDVLFIVLIERLVARRT